MEIGWVDDPWGSADVLGRPSPDALGSTRGVGVHILTEEGLE